MRVWEAEFIMSVSSVAGKLVAPAVSTPAGRITPTVCSSCQKVWYCSDSCMMSDTSDHEDLCFELTCYRMPEWAQLGARMHNLSVALNKTPPLQHGRRFNKILMGDATVLEVESGRVVVKLLTGDELSLTNVNEIIRELTSPGDIWTGGRIGLGPAICVEEEVSKTALLHSFTGYARAPSTSFPHRITSPFTTPTKVLVRGGRKS